MLCDKNYTCQKQAQSEMDKQSNESEKCTKTYINETSKRTKQKEDERHANIVACQPNCTNYYKKKQNSHSDSCCPKKITFDNQTSSVKFSPSFNLRSDKMSTPRQNRFDQSDSGYQTAKTQAQTQTVVDIEQTLNFDKISNASSFHSA